LARIVSNSGPLIALAEIGQFPLLQQLFGELFIASAVYAEVVVNGAGEPGAKETAEAAWIKQAEVQDRLAVDLLRDELGPGESESIVLAKELRADYVFFDDLKARKKARHIGLRVTGTLGVILMAKVAGLIQEVKPLLDQLRQTDFRMSYEMYLEVLTEAGEILGG
jgi:predicted nucleic acid-binding protein